MARIIPIGAILLVWSSVLLAQEKPLIEEIIITAQRVEENLQKVPIAASALTEAMIKDRQIVGLDDLQFHVPNLNYSEQSFSRGRYQIRGIGRQNDVDTGEDGVSAHLDGIPIPAESRLEVFDMERVEVSRGPQGTLYGRNATGGVINIIPRKPSVEAMEGYFELEYGDYDHRRIEGAFNLPLTDTLALRVAGMGLKRDGFTENLADGQVQGVDDDMDGRDLWSARVTAQWWISDRLTVNLHYHHFDEDDDRMLRHALVCKQNPLPTVGCVPNEFGFDPPHPQTANAGFPAFFQPGTGARPVGARDAATGLVFDFPRPDVDFRHQHTDFEPIYEREEDFVGGALAWAGERITVTIVGAYYDARYKYLQDEMLDVDYSLPATDRVPDGLWPTSARDGGIGAFRDSGTCNLNDGTFGVLGGCVWPADQTRHFRYDSGARELTQTSGEIRLHSQLDGPLNFLLGANYLTRHRSVDYLRFDNINDQAALTGTTFPGSGSASFRTSWFHNYFADHYDFDSYSGFGELYWQLTDTVKLTAGLRYNHDKNFIADTFNTPSYVPPFPLTDTHPDWIRLTLGDWYFFGVPVGNDIAIADLYGATEAINDAQNSLERLRAFQRIPLAPALNESRTLEGSSPRQTWDGVSGRIGVAWSPSPQHMLYAFYSRGYKPGGFQWGGESANQPPVGEETVNAIELGAKNRFLDDTMLVNVALFWNDYDGLQLDDRARGLANFDARSWGAELELEWRPARLPNLQISVAYSWLHSEVDDALVFDIFDPLQGNTDHVLLSDPGGELFVAPRESVLPWVGVATTFGFANPAPHTVYPDGIPSLFSRAFLDAVGVETLRGFDVDVGGNEIPMAPEHGLGLGVGYSWYLSSGSVHARWDYYWQSRSFSTVFNNRGSRIPAWEQHNASVTFEAASGRWSVTAWGRNLTDEENVNNSSWQTGAIGFGRFYTLNDPRVFGLTMRVNFGAI